MSHVQISEHWTKKIIVTKSRAFGSAGCLSFEKFAALTKLVSIYDR